MQTAVTTATARRGPLHVTHVITTLDVGGAQVVLGHLVAALRERGVTSDVVVLGPVGSLHDRIVAAGADVVALDRRPVGLLAAIRDLRRHLRERRPDVVHAWLYHAEVVTLLARPDAPVVCGVHHTDLPPTQWPAVTRIAAGLAHRLSRRAAAVTYPGVASRRVHEELGRKETIGRVVPNGVPRAVIRPDARIRLRERLGISPDAHVVGRVGRAHPQKDLPTFVSAVAVARRRHPDLRAVVVGPGVLDDAALTRAIAAQDLGAVVHRWDAQAEVDDLHAGLDLAVSSSSAGEALPTVLIEALAVGTPVVATDVGDSAAIVGDAGRVVPAQHPGELGEAIADLLDLPHEERTELGRRGRRRVMVDHGIDSMVDAVSDVYDAVAAGAPLGEPHPT